MQLLESNFGQFFVIGIIVLIMLSITLYFHLKNKSKVTMNVIDNRSSGFWDFNQTYLVAYMTTSIAIEDKNTDLIKLIYETVGRSKGAIDRKISRFINIFSSKNGLSKLDMEVYNDITNMNDFMAFKRFVKCFEDLGGDSDKLMEVLK